MSAPAAAGARVERAELTICALPLRHPVQLGATTYREREVAVLRLRAADGAVGTALGYTRGTPLLSAFELLADDLVGLDPQRRAAELARIAATRLHGAPSLVRATSLLDVALHDLAAQACGVPLWQLLGGLRDRVPSLAVAGYFPERRSQQEIEQEVLELAARGHRAIKLVVAGADPIGDERFLARVRAALDPAVGLAIDLHGAYEDVWTAQRTIARLEAHGLLFVEDPLPVHARAATARLARRVRVPLAAGEDVAGVAELAELVRAVEVLRVDATTSGGLLAAAAAVELAAARGVAVVPHVWEHTHAQLAGAHRAIAYVERIPAASGADPLDLLGLAPLPLEDGDVVLPAEPGQGIALDEEALARYRVAGFERG